MDQRRLRIAARLEGEQLFLQFAMEDAEDASYLLTDIYTSPSDFGGLLSSSSLSLPPSPTSAFARAALSANLSLLRAASHGALLPVHELLQEMRSSELHSASLAGCFALCVARGQLHVAEYLLRRGLRLDAHAPQDADGGREELLSAACFRVLHAAVEGADAAAAGGGDNEAQAGAASAAELLAAARGAQDAALAGLVAYLLPPQQGKPPPPDAPPPLPAPPFASLIWLLTRVAPRDGPSIASRARSQDGFTPLHIAALEGLLPEAIALLTCGADVNAVSSDGGTPLSVALYGAAEAAREGAAGAARAARCEAVAGAVREAGGVGDWQSAQ